MDAFLNLVTTVALLALLLAVLRHRQHPLPRPLVIGIVLACGCQVFPLATVFVGIERINALVEGRLVGESDFSSFAMSGVEVSEDYIVIHQLLDLLGQTGLLLVALGFLLLVRRIVRQKIQATFQP
jgi:hypothetical protein